MGHRRDTAGLAGLGIHTAADLAFADPGVLRRRWSVILERTTRELAGVPCMPVGFTPKDHQQLMYSRMLGATVSTSAEMRSVLAQYAAAAARRLRAHDLDTALMQVWISSSRFRDDIAHHSAAVFDPNQRPVGLITSARGPPEMEGWPYNRAGILLTGLSPAGATPATVARRDALDSGWRPRRRARRAIWPRGTRLGAGRNFDVGTCAVNVSPPAVQPAGPSSSPSAEEQSAIPAGPPDLAGS